MSDSRQGAPKALHSTLAPYLFSARLNLTVIERVSGSSAVSPDEEPEHSVLCSQMESQSLNTEGSRPSFSCPMSFLFVMIVFNIFLVQGLGVIIMSFFSCIISGNIKNYRWQRY